MTRFTRSATFEWDGGRFSMFATFGLFLESLHGFKVRAYLDVSNETRRLMWTLAHAHGGVARPRQRARRLEHPHPARGRARTTVGSTSTTLLAATVLIPGGFFLGGVVFYAGDPGLGVLILPIGAIALLVAAFLLARDAGLVSSAGPERSIPRRTASETLNANRQASSSAGSRG